MKVGENYTYIGRGGGEDFEEGQHGYNLSAIDEDGDILSGLSGGCEDWHYFKPLKEAPAKEFTLQDAYMKMQSECGIEMGDTVKVIRKAKDWAMGWNCAWAGNCFIGQTGEVLAKPTSSGFYVRLPEDTRFFPFFCLELVKKAPKEITVDLNEDYSAKISPDGDTIKVGGQEFTASQVLHLADKIKEVQHED